jgi:maleylpyruvate isomerase
MPPGRPIRAHEILRARLLELWVHLVDLDHEFGFDDIPDPDVEQLLEDAVQHLADRPDAPDVSIEVNFSDGRQRTWELGTHIVARRVTGRPGPVLGWLLGRHGNERLEGEVPELPAWL